MYCWHGLLCQLSFKTFIGLVELHGESWKDFSELCNHWKNKRWGVGGVLCVCVFPEAGLYFFKKNTHTQKNLNTKECVKSTDIKAPGPLDDKERVKGPKCVQRNCLRSSTNKMEQAFGFPRDPGGAECRIIPSPEPLHHTRIHRVLICRIANHRLSCKPESSMRARLFPWCGRALFQASRVVDMPGERWQLKKYLLLSAQIWVHNRVPSIQHDQHVRGAGWAFVKRRHEERLL